MNLNWIDAKILGLAFILPLSWVACNNNSGPQSPGGNGLQITASNPNSLGNGTGSVGVFTLSNVVKDVINPTEVLDLIGDGSGAFGKLCTSIDGTDPNSTSSATACACTYKYNSNLHPNQTVDIPLIYHEANMIRCNYGSIIPAEINSFTVSLHQTAANQYSNPLTFNFSGSAVTLDPALASTFQMANRYLCKSIMMITSLFDPNIYDPYQSEDPHFTFPLDYYTPSFGGAFEYYVNSGETTDSCPSIPDTSSVPIFSQAPLNGDNTIFPPKTTGPNRSTFYLARKPTSVFNTPINAKIAPSVISNADNKGNFSIPSLGYGAAHLSNGNSGQESCPNATNIPAGFQWVKVWLFRASLGQRSSWLPTTSITIVCNPGDWNIAQPGADPVPGPMYAVCPHDMSETGSNINTNPDGQATPAAISMADITNSTYAGSYPRSYLTSRVISANSQLACVRLDAEQSPQSLENTGDPNNCNKDSQIPGVGCGYDTQTGLIGDFWDIILPPTPAAGVAAAGCSATPLIDPLNICGNMPKPANTHHWTASPIINNLTPSPPFDLTQRYDFIYVVTPTSVNTSDILNPTLGQPYYPFRYLTAADCPTNNPNDTVNCPVTNAITTYAPKLHDIQTNGDPPASDPSRAGIFPICALQPIQ